MHTPTARRRQSSGTDAPPVRLVAIADVNTDFANHMRDRYGF
jgi:hypothetical protein